MSSCFPDVNVWLALAVVEHFHHEAALRWWENCADEIVFCRLTQMGLLRLLTTAATTDGHPLSMERAWQTYDLLVSDPRVRFQVEPASTEAAFRGRSTLPGPAPRLWMDFYLQAFADAANATLVTFDRRLAARHSTSLLLG
jgi:hypothetical protein